jgi:hypothetical protein
MKVRGIIVACERPIVSPLSGAPCVGYDVVIRARRRRGLWTALAHEAQLASFELAQDATPFFVDASGNHDLALRKSSKRISPSERSVAVRGLLERHGAAVDESIFWGHCQIEIREGMIRVGDGVIVWGNDTIDVTPDGVSDGYRQPPIRRTLCGDDQNPVFVSNLPGAGLLESPVLSRRGLLETIFRRRP